MLKILVTMLAVCGVAAAGNAGTVYLELPTCPFPCFPGSELVVKATVVTDGTEVATAFDFISLVLGWNPNVLSVTNAGVDFPFGAGSQGITAGPGVGGAGLTGGASILTAGLQPLCSNRGDRCGFVAQTNASFDAITLDAQTLVATLGLTIGAPASFSSPDLGLQVMSFSDLNGQMNLVFGPVPEPTTGTLLGLGLIALAGRRHSRL